MKTEIEKILDRLERIDHKIYSCSFEFADSGSFDETCKCFDERKKLANYIQKLEQENKRLNGVIETYEILLKTQQKQIDKAIEYIKENAISDDEETFGEAEYQIYKILKGQ